MLPKDLLLKRIRNELKECERNFRHKFRYDKGFNKIPFEILQPIIQETAKKIVELSPYEAQTGPAQRNDSKTIEKHKAMLTVNQQEIYTLLTKSIAKTYGEKL